MANRILCVVQQDMDEPLWLGQAESFIQKAAKELGYDRQEISVLFCNDAYIKELNKTYRNIDAPTDVLSFENGEEYEDEEGCWKCVGDIVISLDTLPVNAEYFNEEKNCYNCSTKQDYEDMINPKPEIPSLVDMIENPF